MATTSVRVHAKNLHLAESTRLELRNRSSDEKNQISWRKNIEAQAQKLMDAWQLHKCQKPPFLPWNLRMVSLSISATAWNLRNRDVFQPTLAMG